MVKMKNMRNIKTQYVAINIIGIMSVLLAFVLVFSMVMLVAHPHSHFWLLASLGIANGIFLYACGISIYAIYLIGFYSHII